MAIYGNSVVLVLENVTSALDYEIHREIMDEI